MNDACKTLKHPDNFGDWAKTWLETAGCNIIRHQLEVKAGKISKFIVTQEVHKNGEGNRLRKQKFSVNLLDKNMKVVSSFDIVTKEDTASFELPEMVG